MSDTAAVAAMSVGRLSKLTGVTIRTLHHYDQIGLLPPSDRSESGYRLYNAGDLERLHRILFYRELGFALDAIAELLSEPQVSAIDHLRRQRELLNGRIARLQAMAAAVDRELEAQQMGIELTPEERFELFGDGYSDELAAEAEQRWGDTEAWQESQRRTSQYSKDDWRQMKAESGRIEQGFVEAKTAGQAPQSAVAMDLAERHRAQITQWFYDCPPEAHSGLGRMYVADERFTAYYEKLAPGLAAYVSAAIEANANRQSSS
jgi:DNA-binding transcriptional MerR regulator